MLLPNSLFIKLSESNHIFFWNTTSKLQQMVQNSIKIIEYFIFSFDVRFLLFFFPLIYVR